MTRISPGDKDPLVSVIIPTHNRCLFLKEAIDSVKRQTYSNWELIIVDNASKDETRSILESMSHPRIKKIYLEQSVGSSRARNVGLAQARGIFALFLDDDDLLVEDALTIHTGYFRRYPRAVATIASRISFDSKGNQQLFHFTGNVQLRNIFWDILFGWFAYTGQCFFLTELLMRIGGWSNEYIVGEGEDQELLLRLSREGPILLVPPVVLLSRVHSGHLRRRNFIRIEKQRMDRIRITAVKQLKDGERKRGIRHLKARRLFKSACREYEQSHWGRAFFSYLKIIWLVPNIACFSLMRRSVLGPLIRCALFRRPKKWKQGVVGASVQYVD